MPFIITTIACIILVSLFLAHVTMSNKASRHLDEFYLGEANLPHGHGVLGSFLDEAINACKAANNEHGNKPSVYLDIVDKQILRWEKAKNEDHKYNFF